MSNWKFKGKNKISKIEIEKITYENNDNIVNFTLYNEHKHEKTKNIMSSSKDIRIKNNLENLTIKLISQNISEPLEFHIKNSKWITYILNHIKLKIYYN